MGHARAISTFNEKEMLLTLNEILENNLSVRAVEEKRKSIKLNHSLLP